MTQTKIGRYRQWQVESCNVSSSSQIQPIQDDICHTRQSTAT